MSLFGRQLGYIRSPERGRALDYVLESMPATFGFAGIAPPREVDLRQYAPEIINQGSSSSCVGHGISTAYSIAEHKAGLRVERPSPRAIYAGALAEMHRKYGVTIRDGGCYPRDGFGAFAKVGAPDISKCKISFTVKPPFNNATVPPPMSAMLEGHARAGGTYARVMSFGSERISTVKRSLAAGNAVGIGTQVSQKFVDGDGVELFGPPGLVTVGGHFMCIVAYDTTHAGTTRFLTANSWGKSWGIGGYGWLTQEYIEHPYTTDLWSVSLREGAANA